MSIRERIGSPEHKDRASLAKEAKTNTPPVDCMSRSVLPVGKLRCTCSNQPSCYACAHPFVSSGYCMSSLPQQPGDGAIVMQDGTSLAPKDTRFKTFIPWPLKSGEVPHAAALVVCETCPNRQEPPTYVARLRALGIDGDYDPTNGTCDVVHYMPGGREQVDSVAVPHGIRACTVMASKVATIESVLDATGCRLMILYAAPGNYQQVKSAGKRFPNVLFWFVSQPAKLRKERIENVIYDLSDEVEAEIQAKRKSAYAEAIQQILS